MYRGSEFLVDTSEDVGWRLFRDGNYELWEIEIIEQFIESADVCIDVGGNIGIYSVFFGRKTDSSGRVYVFEPVPANQYILRFNLMLNDIANVHLVDAVVSDKEGKIEFSISEDAAYSSIHHTGRKEASGSLIKDSITLDNFLSGNLDKIGVVKIDTEGAELLD